MSIQKKPVRNLAARSTLLRKAGPHLKSKTGQRVKVKLTTRSLLDEWFDEDNEINEDIEMNNDSEIKKGAKAPFFISESLLALNSPAFCKNNFFTHI